MLKYDQARLYIAGIICLFLSFGCFYQILDICRLYYEYPTNIFIETNFNSVVNTFPAITFCTKLKPFNDGLNNSYALDKASKNVKQKLFNDMFIQRYSPSKTTRVGKEFLNKSSERISYGKYCFSFNFKISGKTLLRIPG